VQHRPLKTDLSVWVVLFLLLGFLVPILGSTPSALLANATPSQFLKPVTIGALPARFGEEFINTAVDYVGYWTLPFRWKEAEWHTFWVVAGISAGLFLVDQPIFKNLDSKNFQSFNDSLQPFHDAGQWQYTGMFATGVYLSSYLLEDTKLERASRIAIKSLLFQSVVNQGIKNILYRTKIEDPYDVRLLPPRWAFPSNGAFPSGHASNMWSLWSGFALAYEDDPVIPWLCYGAASIGSLLLVTNSNHWVSDIFLGAALGYYTAEYVRYVDDQRTQLYLIPIVNATTIGLALETRL
jgi:hypothetical protein